MIYVQYLHDWNWLIAIQQCYYIWIAFNYLMILLSLLIISFSTSLESNRFFFNSYVNFRIAFWFELNNRKKILSSLIGPPIDRYVEWTWSCGIEILTNSRIWELLIRVLNSSWQCRRPLFLKQYDMINLQSLSVVNNCQVFWSALHKSA